MSNKIIHTHQEPYCPVILIVDPNPLTLQVSRNLLNTQRYQIYTATKFVEAKGLIEFKHPDIILIDETIGIPDIVQLIHQVQNYKSAHKTSVILLLKDLIQNNSFSVSEQTVVDVLKKPFSDDELSDKIKFILALKMQNEVLHVELKNKNKLFTIVSHDIRGFLSVINGFTEILIKNEAELTSEQTMNILADIRTTVNDALDFLSGLLEWAQVQDETKKFNPEVIGLKNFSNDIIKHFRIMAGTKKISLNAQVNDFKIYADRNMLHLIMRNLLSNAIKFTPSRGVVEIRSIPVVDQVKIQISDSGIGMEAKQMENLFKIDQKISTPGTDNEQGTGMGLILCHEFLQYHQSALEINSTPGKGTIIEFHLPIAGKKQKVQNADF